MDFKLERRAFIKAGVGLLSYHRLCKVLCSTAAYGSLSSTISYAGGTNAPVTVDSISVTVDSMLIIISDEVLPPEPSDSDGDGLIDWDEITVYGTNHLNPDSDSDGLFDGEEVMVYGTQPLNQDTDGDGFSDGFEIAAASDPLDESSFPLNYGDVNLDGQVNVADSLLATRIVHGDITATPDQLLHGDVAPLINGYPSPDGKITTGDLVVIMRKVLGLVNY